MSFVDNPVMSNHDDYFTRFETWSSISCFIPRSRIIWEPFYSPYRSSGDHFRKLGFEVIFQNDNFFESNHGDILVSNMPYSKKKEVFTRLKELEKPFIMLVPSTTLHTKYFYDLFKDERIQLIIPKQKINFDKCVDGVIDEKQKSNCSFYTLFICWKMELRRDVIFI